MFPFWEVAIAPVLKAAAPAKVVEVGALRGETTVLMFEHLPEGCELHVIDPVPSFDPADHEQAYPGRYIFHRDLSVNALVTLPPVDVALLDGDHNWYTVYNELRILGETAEAHDRPLPLCLLHDVLWPYGRRDLYYAPDTIPEEFRQNYAQLGMVRGKEVLAYLGGVNPTMYNAVRSGGPRNGVMTGIDDFVAEYPHPIRRLTLPIYFGLEFLADERYLDAHPAVREVLDELEGADKRHDLLELAEDLRLQSVEGHHALFFSGQEQHEKGARRYLELLKKSLLDELYVENSARIEHLRRALKRGVEPDPEHLRDPRRHLSGQIRKIEAERRTGIWKADDLASGFPYSTMGRPRMDRLEDLLDTIRTEAVTGDLVTAGVGRGGSAIFLRGYLESYSSVQSHLWVADRFGVPVPNAEPDAHLLKADLNQVRDAMAAFDLFDDRTTFLMGDPRETLVDAPIERVCLIHVHLDGSDDGLSVIDQCYDKMSTGGFVLVEGCSDEANLSALVDLRHRRGITESLDRVDLDGVVWRKLEEAAVPSDGPDPARQGRPLKRAPIVAPISTGSCDLTVVVVFYNMAREAHRTLLSLSRSYQRDIDDLDYEVLVVENGSDPDQKLDPEAVASYGQEFRYIDMGTEARPSPIPALNRAIEQGRGNTFALMIDGAHVLSPRVLHFGMLGLATYAPAMVATQHWYVGPGQQGEAMTEGYDQAFEDRLFEQINWPSDGYRLFDISHFIGDRDWLDGMWESNCLFTPRALLTQLGAFDESFDMPGGGYANLELYERLASNPDVTVATMLGEGSFHQFHGGTTTNQPLIEERRRRITSYADHFAEIRGREFGGHNKAIHYVGTIVPEARRTRARRRIAPNLFQRGVPGDPDGFPESASPLPQDLDIEFTDAYFRTLAWQSTDWLGHSVPRPPGDLLAYQEILSRVRPDWIIDIGTGNGGRAWFLASICDLVGHGRVFSIDRETVDDRPEHERIHYRQGNPLSPKVLQAATDALSGKRAMLILGARATRPDTIAQFDAYRDFVSVGSYAVIEDTVVNGNPVWASFGAGPGEAAKRILRYHHDFAADTALERYRPNFNPTGYLRRVR